MDLPAREQYGNVAAQRKMFHGTAGRDNQPRRRHDADQTVFRIYKGVKTFDYSREKNVIVTGGKICFLFYLNVISFIKFYESILNLQIYTFK